MLNCIQGYKIPFSTPPSQRVKPNNFLRSESEIREARVAIERLIAIGAVVPCTDKEGQFISSFFLIPKADGSKRFILNLKNLNKFIESIHFKMEDLRTAIKLLTPKAFMCNLDLKDAYFFIPVAKGSRKFLRFIFEGQMYEFTCLPFGLCTSPYVFTKVMKAVISGLRKQGLYSTVYLDDILVLGTDFESCMENLKKN